MTGRILGSIKEGETTVEQQIILFYILLGKRFDVGRLINMKISAIRAKIRSDTMRKLALSFPSIITLLCRDVQRPKGSFEIECMQPITDKQIFGDSRDEPSVLEFHRAHWGNREYPSWVPPETTTEHPTGPPTDDDMPGPDVGSSSHAPFDPHA
jgi:hypothetical protein